MSPTDGPLIGNVIASAATIWLEILELKEHEVIGIYLEMAGQVDSGHPLCAQPG